MAEVSEVREEEVRSHRMAEDMDLFKMAMQFLQKACKVCAVEWHLSVRSEHIQSRTP